MGLGALPVLLFSGYSNIQQIQNRNTLKDAIIIIQSILLVIFISVPVLIFLDKVSDGTSGSRGVPRGRTLPGMTTGRHWVWSCYLGAWLVKLGN